MDILFTQASLTALVCGYLIGSIPSGLLLARAAGLGDIRDIGSGNIGATNVLRTGNKSLAAATLILDVLKGLAAVVLAYFIAQWLAKPTDPNARVVLSAYPWMVVALGGLGAFLGHLFPIWLRFKGGKGVATMIGVLLGLKWPIALVFCVIWLATAAITRFSSLAAILASLASVLTAYLITTPHVSAVTAFMTALLIWKHQPNITRLRNGEEPKIGGAAKPK